MDKQVKVYYPGLLESGSWFRLSLMEQLANIGTELDRCIRRKNEGRLEESHVFFEATLTLLDYTIADPKHGARIREVVRAKELLIDYFVYDNVHQTSDEYWHNYFMFFSYIAAEERAQKYEARLKLRKQKAQ